MTTARTPTTRKPPISLRAVEEEEPADLDHQRSSLSTGRTGDGTGSPTGNHQATAVAGLAAD